MKKCFTILILVIAVLQYFETNAQDKDLNTTQDKIENNKLDTRVDNMGYWNRMIESGIVKGNPSYPFKPAEYKGSKINSKAVPTDSPDVVVWNESGVTQSENSIFVDPSDNQHTLNSNNSEEGGGVYGANYIYSNDAGQTWAGSKQGAGGGNNGDPAAVINNSGRQFVGYINSTGGMSVSYRNNDGDSWTPVTVYSPGSQDKNHLWVDNSSSTHQGNLYNSWVDLNGSSGNYADNILSRSTDNGVSWSSPVINLSSGVSAGSHNQGVNIQTGPNGEVYTVWAIYDSWPSNETALGMAKSTNGGSSFAAATRIITNINGIRNSGVSKNMRVNSFPSMAVDISSGTYSGNIYVTWSNYGDPNNSNSGSNISVYMIRSTNGGTLWSSPIRVNQGAFTNGKEAYFGWITCDPATGFLYVVFYDDRDVSSSQCETWVAISEDAGATWEDFRVSDVAFTPSPIPGLATGYFGDYLGITARDGWVYPCWTDNRSGSALTYVSAFQYPPSAPDQWNGSTSTNWNTGSNWDDGTVPTSSDDVIIPTSAPNWPTYSGNMILGTTCRDITIQGAGELSVTGDFTIPSGKTVAVEANGIIRIGGDWDNDGTFTIATGTVEFNGTTSSFITGPPSMSTIFYDGFESDLGWSLAGEFERAAPTGLGGEYGNPDPTSAFAGSNVLGVDLSGQGTYPGDYENNLGDRAYQAVSPTINCTGFTNVSMNFQRWLGVETPTYDHAYIDISTDNGSTWPDQIWTNTSGVEDSEWGLQTIDISSYADNQSQVKIRFCMGSSDGSWQYCGWNIDEFEITGSGAPSAGFYNLIISKTTNAVSTNSDVSVANDLTVKPDGWFTNNTGNTVDVAGDLLLEADDTGTGMASFIDNGTTTVTGVSSVEQYVEFNPLPLEWGQWHLVSAPISDATINTYYDMFLYQYHEDGNAGAGYWENLVTPVTTSMNVGQGYNITGSSTWIGTTTVTYTTGALGTLNSSDVPITGFTRNNTDTTFRGFKLVGNPFPCAIDWNSNTDWNRSGLNGWMVILDDGTYRGYHTGGTPYNGKTDGLIPSTQGFFVRATSLPATLTIPKSQRVHNSQAFYKGIEDFIYPIVRLEAQTNDHSDESVVVFHPEGSVGFDDYYDLSKFTNAVGLPNLYSVSEGINYAFSFLSEEYIDMIVPVYFEMDIPGICQIKATEIENIDNPINVYLEDLNSGIITELKTKPVYEFDHSIDNDPHRFNLHFKESWYGVEDISLGNINIYSANDYVYIITPEMQSGDVFIYDMLGQEILSRKISESDLTKIRVTNGSAYYLVKFQSDEILITEKVFIK